MTAAARITTTTTAASTAINNFAGGTKVVHKELFEFVFVFILTWRTGNAICSLPLLPLLLQRKSRDER